MFVSYQLAITFRFGMFVSYQLAITFRFVMFTSNVCIILVCYYIQIWDVSIILACYFIQICDVSLKCSYHTSLLLHLDLGCLPQMFAFNPLESFTNIQIEFIPDANKCDSMLRITYLSQLHFNFSVSHFCFVFVLNCVSVPFSR